MNEFKKAIDLAVASALSEADAVYKPQIDELRQQILGLQGELLAFKVVADSLAKTAATTDKQSAAALLDIASENWPGAPESLVQFEAARGELQAMLLRH